MDGSYAVCNVSLAYCYSYPIKAIVGRASNMNVQKYLFDLKETALNVFKASITQSLCNTMSGASRLVCCQKAC